ncbi:GlsB/YeaQ/YmgE family stress response membrane protein [Roseovarius aestuariivivens]|uniref:GlsB/YeaQ/YmgE family stress response membrane protein n=1 Tax=Roseovarius aestuariivivens TaxID=1888910 RepID=UPI0010815A49|nr:GlsB/YeaQ/YmgE family stress response membrane protein [Roseovarius aestuariivivens]
MNVRTGMLQTILIGIAGALIGGLVLRLLLTAMGLLGGFVGAVLGAVVLIWLWQIYQDRK